MKMTGLKPCMFLILTMILLGTTLAQSTTIDKRVADIENQFQSGAIDDYEAYSLLDMQYQALTSIMMLTTDKDLLEVLSRTESRIEYDLDAITLARFKADDASLEGLIPAIQAATVDINKMAYYRWCNRTVWRRIRRYHKPDFCPVK
jgi:hypothetical protein